MTALFRSYSLCATAPGTATEILQKKEVSK